MESEGEREESSARESGERHSHVLSAYAGMFIESKRKKKGKKKKKSEDEF